MDIKNITIRVYGIVMDNTKGVLVSDEYIRGKYYTKFPGGGLEPGEGTKDCLIREMKEETGVDVNIGAHIYTTDFFQPSAFKDSDQIISIYYHVIAENNDIFQTNEMPFAFGPKDLSMVVQAESLRWLAWENFNAESVSLPIDKVVVALLKENLSNINSF